MVWSCLSATTAAAQNYNHLIAIRFLLGIAEAPFFPGVFYLVSCWYTRKELGFRTAILYSGLVLATAFLGLIAAGVFAGLEGVRGLAGWRWLFIIEGVASFAFGAAAVLFSQIYRSPRQAVQNGFSQEEQLVAIDRMGRDRVSDDEGSGSVWRGLKLACMDYKTWVFVSTFLNPARWYSNLSLQVIMLIANHTAYGFNYFYPSIVKGFNLGSTTITLVLTAPPYILATICSFCFAYSSDHRGERGFHIAIPMSMATIGFIILPATLNITVHYVASFLFICGYFSANAMLFSWAASTLSHTPEKRACATSMINLLSQLGNIWSPYFFRPQDATRYLMAMLLMMGFSLSSVGSCMVMKVGLKREYFITIK
jgi:MFS family permease